MNDDTTRLEGTQIGFLNLMFTNNEKFPLMLKSTFSGTEYPLTCAEAWALGRALQAYSDAAFADLKKRFDQRNNTTTEIQIVKKENV